MRDLGTTNSRPELPADLVLILVRGWLYQDNGQWPWPLGPSLQLHPRYRCLATSAIRGQLGYRLMRSRGPNDGLTLLADELIPGARPIVAPHVDHFLGTPEEQLVLSAALFRTIFSVEREAT